MFVVSVDDKATGTAILLYLHSFIHEWNIQPFPAASLQIWSACLCPWPRSLRALCSPCESSDSRRLPWPRHTAHEVTTSSRWTGDGWRWSNQARCSASYWNLFCFWAGSYFSAPFSAQLFPKICLLSPCFLSPSFSSSLHAKHMLMFSLIQSCSCQNFHDLHIAYNVR